MQPIINILDLRKFTVDNIKFNLNKTSTVIRITSSTEDCCNIIAKYLDDKEYKILHP